MSQRDDRAEREVGELISGAGPRSGMPEERLGAIREAARASWRSSLEETRGRGARSRGSAIGPLAVAAALFALLAAAVWWGLASGWIGAGRVEDADASPVAVVERAVGAVVARAAGAPERLAEARRLTAGESIRTAAGDGLAVLEMGGEGSLRLAPGSRVELVAPAEVTLAQGAVYFDSDRPAVAGGPALTVRTPWGVVQDVGTQLEVRILAPEAAGVLRVRVREGEARLVGPGVRASAGRGEQLVLGRDGEVERAEVATFGEPWAWVIASARPFDLREGRVLGELLDWVARETGWRVRFEDPAQERLRGEVLHGGVLARPDLDYRDPLLSVGLEGVEENGVLTLRAVSEG